MADLRPERYNKNNHRNYRYRDQQRAQQQQEEEEDQEQGGTAIIGGEHPIQETVSNFLVFFSQCISSEELRTVQSVRFYLRKTHPTVLQQGSVAFT